MSKLALLLGAHNHQPVGNFDFVLHDATERSYAPFLELLERHDQIKYTLHFTGFLLDWLVKTRPGLIDQVRRLVDRGQIELFGGGYYEPIVPILPPQDQLGQVVALGERLGELFGRQPRGMWLAERVWEPSLVEPLAQAGIRYVTVDDLHFQQVGFRSEQLHGYYLTEDRGYTVGVFPIDVRLRYTIPFASPEEVIAHLRQVHAGGTERAAVFFDDGEKFGVWPGTYATCYEQGWIDRFFRELARQDWLETLTFGEYFDRVPALGRVYLPTSSYFEMGEWALPPERTRLLLAAREATPVEFEPFLRGGFWRHFLVKYPEANNLHKKAWRVARKLAAAGEGDTLEQARWALWRGQCNDAYWHGAFGGLYLPHLRSALYHELIEAENLIDQVTSPDPVRVETVDFDCDGQVEVLVETNQQNLYFAPHQGATLFEWDYKPGCFNLLDTLARRPEAYHSKLEAAREVRADGTPEAVAIHNRIVTKESGLEKLLFYDRTRRTSLIDRFLRSDVDLADLYSGNQVEVGDFSHAPYWWEVGPITAGGVQLKFWREGLLDDQLVLVERQVSIPVGDASLAITYTVTNRASSRLETAFSVEWNVNFLAPMAPDRFFIDEDARMLNSSVQAAGRTSVGIQDEWLKLRFTLEWDVACQLFRYPVETVSQSEAGIEKIYQGSAIVPVWDLRLDPGQSWQVHIEQGVRSL